MSKSSKNTAHGGTAILCIDADLSSAADAILALAGKHKLSKPALLNILTAQICGDKHDWGFVKNAQAPLVSKRAKSTLNDILEALSAPSTANPEDAESLDAFTLSCIEYAKDVFISCAEGGDMDLVDDLDELFNSKEISAAIDQAAREFIADHFGLPITPVSRLLIEQNGKSDVIGEPIYASEWVRINEILDPDWRREVEDQAQSYSNDSFTRTCFGHAADVMHSMIQNDVDLQVHTDPYRQVYDLVEEVAVQTAIELIINTFGNPIPEATRDRIRAAGVAETIHAEVGKSGKSLFLQNLASRKDDAEKRLATRASYFNPYGAVQDQASRPNVEPQAPGTLGEGGRNAGAFMEPKTKTLGYQVLHREDLHCWGGRRFNEVLSAVVAEADIEAAKAAGVGDDYTIVRVMEGNIQDPIFID